MAFLDSDLVMLGVFAFLAGMGGMVVFTKLKTIFGSRHETKGTLIEPIVLEYTRRLREYDKVIAELRVKVDSLESNVKSQRIESQEPLQTQNHVTVMSEPVTVTQHVGIEEEVNSTTDYIFKLLAERPRSSREVQLAIGRTREHTSRLMKKLHDLGLVSRDINAKPFRYTITEAGQEMLKKRAEPASVAV